MTMDIRDVAARYLAYQNRTVEQMRKHLLQKGFEQTLVEQIIVEFIEYGYLDDARYCRDYFTYAFEKGKGKRLIFSELVEKGVDRDLIGCTFQELDGEGSEKQRARKEAEKVLGLDCREDGKPVSEKILAKAARRLQSKGYDSDVIYSVIGELRR